MVKPKKLSRDSVIFLTGMGIYLAGVAAYMIRAGPISEELANLYGEKRVLEAEVGRFYGDSLDSSVRELNELEVKLSEVGREQTKMLAKSALSWAAFFMD